MFGRRSNSNTTIIGRGARFVGSLELEGPVYIEGECEGAIRAKTELSVGPRGSVLGEVTGSVVTIAGRVEGTVVANEALHVLKTGTMKGDAFYGKLRVDGGGVIDGRSRQGPPNAPLSERALPPGQEAEEGSAEQSGVVTTSAHPTSVFPRVAGVRASGAPGAR